MADNMNGSIMEEDNSFGGRVKKAAKRVDNFWRGVADFINPNVAREGFTPSNIARDVNMWVEPVSQMALDEAQGRAEYPAWAMALGGIPVVGKVASKVAGRVAAKGGAKAGAKGAAQPLMDSIDRLGKGNKSKYDIEITPELENLSNTLEEMNRLTAEANGKNFNTVLGQNQQAKVNVMAEELAKQGQPFKYENGRWDFDYDKINAGANPNEVFGNYETYKITATNPKTGETVVREIPGTVDAQNIYDGFRNNGWNASVEGLKTASELQTPGALVDDIVKGKENLVPAKDFVWKHPNGEIMTVRARDLDEATELINKEVEKIGGVPHTAEISDGSRGRYFVYANPTEDGYVLSGSRGKNDKYFDNLEEAQAYMNGFPKYDYERGLMDEYKSLKAPTMKKVQPATKPTGLLADTPAGPYNAEFVPGEGSIMEGAKPKKYVMHYPDGGELEFESMEKLKEYADLLRKNVGVGGGFKIIER